jgi:hypothetical protein
LTGSNEWFNKEFKSDYLDIISDSQYALMRYWLLGTWMASKAKKDFHFANLIPNFKEEEIETNFGKHIIRNERRKFQRLT